MDAEALRDKLRSEVERVDAAALLPHHRRGALLTLAPEVDLVDAAVAIAADDTAKVAEWVDAGALTRPSSGQLADWCVDPSQRFQFVILQPYVLAQALPRDSTATYGPPDTSG